MAFYKICACGRRITALRRLSFPDICPGCGKSLKNIDPRDESEPWPESPAPVEASPAPEASAVKETPSPEAAREVRYCLRLRGSRIGIPPGGCIIGRTETGGEELAEFGSVSRKHLKVIPRRNLGVIIEDISSYGTLLNGEKLTKNQPKLARPGDIITLCDTDTTLTEDEEP